MEIVTGIPELIERVVQGARLVQDALNINKNVEFDFQHGQHVAHQLILMGDIIKRTKYFATTEKQIEEALRMAEEATAELVEKLEEVRCKSGIKHDKTSPQSQTTKSSQETFSEKNPDDAFDASSGTIVSRASCFGVHFKTITLRNFWSKKKAASQGVATIKTLGRKVIIGTLNRVHYLTLIERDIKAALVRMDKAHMDLFHLMFIAPIHSRLVGDQDAQEFIRNAQERLKDERPLEQIHIPREWLRPVDERLKANEFEEERPYSLYTVTNGPYEGCLIDRRDIRHLRCKHMEKVAQSDTDTLARLLRRDTTSKDLHIDGKIAVLRCRGVSFPNVDIHDLVFQLPPGFGAPQTLRRVLLDEGLVSHVRDARVELAIQLCTAVHVLHSLDIVHKGVRPDNIILLPPIPGSSESLTNKAFAETLGKPFLAGFCYSRSDNSQSGMEKPYEAIFAEIIYHHPRHIKRWRDFQYDKSDDIYSLGICLLEIGLWQSLLHWNEAEKWYVVQEDWQLEGPQYWDEYGDDAQDAWYKRRNLFIKLAREKLPVTMTSTYAEVVLACLEFRERENAKANVSSAGSHDFVGNVLSKLLSMKY